MAGFNNVVIMADGNNLVFNLGAGNTVMVENWYIDGGLGSIQLGNDQTFGYRLGTEQNANLQGTAIRISLLAVKVMKQLMVA